MKDGLLNEESIRSKEDLISSWGVVACADFLITAGQRFNPSLIKVLQLIYVACQF